jgi:lipooligosaccharide transport system permease protein
MISSRASAATAPVIGGGPVERPPSRFGRAHLVMVRGLMVHRHRWTILAFGVLEPVLYLLSIGVGVGRLVGHVSGLVSAGGPPVSYPEYVAPALLAMAAMNGAVDSATQQVFARLRFDNTYQIMLTTPVTPRDIAVGEVAWATLRGGIEATGFLAVMTALGLVHSPWALLAVPGALLIGFAFASVGLFVATFLRGWQDFQLIQLVMLPMFLFATTFYPLRVYPAPIRVLVSCLPLYHGINLVREPVLGLAGTRLLVPVGYLAAMGLAGLWLAVRRLDHVLLD